MTKVIGIILSELDISALLLLFNEYLCLFKDPEKPNNSGAEDLAVKTIKIIIGEIVKIVGSKIYEFSTAL